MKRKWTAAVGFLIAAVIAGCETTAPTAPPITAAVIQAGADQRVHVQSLTTGRSLFVNRCARCHTLPAVGEQSPEDWPGIVGAMSQRAGLKAEQSKSVLAYILAAQTAARR